MRSATLLLLLLLLGASLAQNRWEDRAITQGAPSAIPPRGEEVRSVSRFMAERLVNKSGDLFFPRLASERDHRIRAHRPKIENRDRAEISRIINLRGTRMAIDNNSPLSLFFFLLFSSLDFLPISFNELRSTSVVKKKRENLS